MTEGIITDRVGVQQDKYDQPQQPFRNQVKPKLKSPNILSKNKRGLITQQLALMIHSHQCTSKLRSCGIVQLVSTRFLPSFIFLS